jgi:hypothetical protein
MKTTKPPIEDNKFRGPAPIFAPVLDKTKQSTSHDPKTEEIKTV